MHALLFFSFSALICSLSIVPFAESRKSLSSFSIDLIHRDSPLSPFYNSSLTPSELIRNAALRSIARFNGVHQFSLNENDQSPETIIVPDGGDYLMRIYIGTPPVERLAFADTGSDLIWVQCSPCEGSNCFPQDTPLFDPNKSSTFVPVSCDSQPCTLLPQRQRACGNSNECNYLYLYGDKSFTEGELATDSINFGSTSAGQGVTFPKSIFGCGYRNSFTSINTQKSTGLVGLGAGPLSLVSQLGDEIGHKFSYCLVPPASTTNSKLKFGNGAIISGNGVVSTPLIIKPSSPTFYYLNLEGISVGQNTVQSGQTSGNIIIDSGTTLTYLEPSFYNSFVASVKEALGVEAVQNPPNPFNFCASYDGSSVNFPDFVFHFTGADVPLKPGNLFAIVHNNFLCLLVVPNTNTNEKSILGNVAQINFQVEYDLEGKKVSFAPTDCTKN